MMADYPTTEEEIERAASDVWQQLYVESDRGCIMIAAALLDDALASMLHYVVWNKPGLNRDKRLNIMGWTGPLGTFSSRLTMAYTFGLIDQWVYDIIESVRSIRNSFAHGYKNASFDNEDLSNAVLNMTSPEYNSDEKILEIFKIDELPDVLEFDNGTTIPVARLHFVVHVGQVANRIFTKTREFMNEKP